MDGIDLADNVASASAHSLAVPPPGHPGSGFWSSPDGPGFPVRVLARAPPGLRLVQGEERHSPRAQRAARTDIRAVTCAPHVRGSPVTSTRSRVPDADSGTAAQRSQRVGASFITWTRDMPLWPPLAVSGRS